MIETQELKPEIISNDPLIGELGKTIDRTPATLITKDIVQNGTYNASDDNADGYSKVNVNIKQAPNYISFYRYTGETLDVSWLDTHNITNMSFMFEHNSQLTQLDLSNFDTSNVITMASMFHNCGKLVTLDFRNAVSVANASYSNMFQGCNKLEYLYLNKFDYRNVSAISNMMGGTGSARVPLNCKIYVLDQYAKDTLENLGYTNVEIAS